MSAFGPRSRYQAAAALFLCATVASTASLAQKSGGNLTIAFPANQESPNLDGHIDSIQPTWLYNSFVADPLVVMDSDAKYKPALALSWESNADGTVWTFKLRPGVKFHDGTPFDAAAAKYNFDRVMDPKTASAQMKSEIGPIKSVDVIDPLTIQVRYDTPWVTLLDGVRRMPIWSPTAAEKFGLTNFQRNLVGTGPFTFVEWVKNDRMVFKKWPDYKGGNSAASHQGPAYLDTVTVRFIGENSVLNGAVANGTTLAAVSLTPDAIPDYKDSKTATFYAKGQSGTGLQMVMNVRRPPLNDIKVRQALLYARDMPAINKLLYDGQYIKSDGPLDNVHPCYWDGASEMYKPDLAKTRELLDAAGWRVVAGKPIREAQGVAGVADGTPLKINYVTIHHKEIGEALQAQFRRAGIDLAVELVPAGPIQADKVNRRDFDLMFLRQRTPDPVVLDQVWNSKWDQPGGWAWTGFKNEELDKTVGMLRTLGDFNERCEVAKKAQKIIMDNAVMLPTLSQPAFTAVSNKVKNFKIGSEGNWFFIHSAWIDN